MASPIVHYAGGKDYSRGTKFSCMATSGAGSGRSAPIFHATVACVRESLCVRHAQQSGPAATCSPAARPALPWCTLPALPAAHDHT